MESSRTSLASRTSSRAHFEVLGLGLEGQVLGLGLEASCPRKLAFWKTFFCGDRLKNFCEDLFFALVSLVLGLEHSCSWPQECLSLERLSLALASDFFVSLALASPCVLDSTSDNSISSIKACFLIVALLLSV